MTNVADKMLRKANIRDRDMVLILALRFIHDNGMENKFLDFLDSIKKEIQ